MATREPAGGGDLFSGPRATRRPAVQARWHAVVAGHPLAALAGQRILDRGGNAADAGVAAGICTAVLLPDLVSLGGVAPVVYYDRRSDEVVTVSGLGRWPRAASTDAVRDARTGQMARDLRCCVVPAAVDAWLLVLERYGTMRLADVAADAIELCQRGFPVYDVLAASIALHGPKLARYSSSAAVFMPDGQPLGVGDLLVQPDLARTLRRLVEAEAAGASAGRAAGLRAARDLFYRGEIAEEVARFSRENGGLLAYEDMASFAVKLEPPTRTTYRGYELFGCGPWCQGPTLPIALNVLEGYDLAGLGHNSPAYLHLLTEALKAAFSDREHYLADPEFVDVPLDDLLSRERGTRWRELIDRGRAWPELPPRLPAGRATGGRTPPARPAAAVPPDTSYACVVDREGNVFSATPSDGFTEVPLVPGLGFVISPRGTQSWIDPEHPACVAPGKRPRLTPAPFILFRDGRPVMPFGTPGADVQPQAMLQFLLNVVEFGMDPQAAAEAPRLATYSMPITADPHPCRPNLLRLEERAGAAAFEGLAALGHDLQPWPDWHPAAGSVCGIWIDQARGTLTAGADPRRAAYALGW
jgi:gamma-glutamyltranspeptidase/glutathione hydrolase